MNDRLSLVVLAAVSLCLSMRAGAQEAAAASSTSAGTSGLEEIVVTANKREENINKVGATVTAIGADALAERQITSLQDLAATVPGLSFAQSGTATPILTLRGIGFNEETLGVYPAVSVYVDEVPLPFPVMTLHSDFDLQRVEVLKGPQGTLFGENSTGGAINYIAAKPTKQEESGGSITYGRFNEVAGDAYISGPLSDTVGARLAFTARNQDGWQYSYTRPGDTNGKISYFAGRLVTDWEPVTGTRIALTLSGWHDGSQPQSAQLAAVRPQIPPGVHPTVLSYPFAPRNDRAADWSVGIAPTTGANLSPSSDRNLYSAALRADLDVSASMTLTSLTSFAYWNQRLSVDKDGIGGPQPPVPGTAAAPNLGLIANIAPDIGAIHSFNQELRLANSKESADRWVLGANFERSTVHERQDLFFGDDSNDIPAQLNIDTTSSTNEGRFTNYAIFANNEYDLSPRLTLRAGARYTKSKDEATICNATNGDGNVGALFNLLPLYFGQPPGNVKTGGCYNLNDIVAPGTPGYFEPGATYRNTLQQSNVSWKVGADFHVNDNSLLYANASRGYKAGSFPTLAGSKLSENNPVVQESVTAFELGTKNSLLDRRMQLNAAAFYYDYKDKQVRSKTFDPIFGNLDVLTNIPKSRVYGAEGDVVVKPVQSLTLSGNVTYLKSEVREYEGYTVVSSTKTNLAGVSLPFTPRWAGTLDADYRVPIGNGGKPFVGVTILAQSSSASQLGGENIAAMPAGAGTCPSEFGLPTTPPSPPFPAACFNSLPGLAHPFLLPAYATVDLRLGYESGDGRWTTMLWGKNIGDRYYLTNANQYLDVTTRYTGMPLTYGLSVFFKH